ncbi:MAG: sensor histidine kinase, partial [Chloroflexota bacterium]
QVLLEVLDHGIGVPESERDALFAPFSRTASAVDAGVEGTGLGLYICRRIVEAHGGRIDQRETPGGGSIFWVSLPVRQVATNSASDGEAPQASDAA